MGTRLITLKCDSCGADLELTVNKDFAYCPYCGTKILIKEESIRINKEDAKEAGFAAGYSFEQGRKKAAQEVNELRKSIQDRVPYHMRSGKSMFPEKPKLKSILDKPEVKSVLDKPEVRSFLDKPEVQSILWKLWKK